MRAIAAIDWRERRSYPTIKVGIAFFAVIALGGAFPPQSEPISKTHRVGVVGELPAGVEELLGLPGNVRLRFIAQPDRAAAEDAVRSSAVEAAVVDGEVLAHSRASTTPVDALRRALPRAEAARRLEAVGLEALEARRVAAVEPAPVRLLEPMSSTRKANVALAQRAAMSMGFIVFLLLMFLVNGVQEERGRRMADVLVVALKPVEIVTGKVLGATALGLTVVVLAAVPAVALVLAVRGGHVVGELGATALAIPCWFALQSALYGCVAITTGATAPSPDEAGLKGLVSGTFMATGSLGAAAVAWAPDSAVVVGLSFFPPLAAPVMLVRAAAGDVAAWEIALSMALMAATVVAVARLAARVYLGGVVRAGDTLNIRSAFRAGRRGASRHRGQRPAAPPEPAPPGQGVAGHVDAGEELAATARDRAAGQEP